MTDLTHKQVTRIDRYRLLNRWTYDDLGKCLGVHGSTARRYCLPVSHNDWRWINYEAGELLKQISAGTIHAGNYHELVNMPNPLTAVMGLAEPQERAA